MGTVLEVAKAANLALRFLLELCALSSLGYWDFKTGGGLVTKIGLGIGVPLVAAAVWATFVAPGAAVPAPGALRLLLELAVFGLAVAALYAVGRPGLAVALGVVYATNRALMVVWGQ